MTERTLPDAPTWLLTGLALDVALAVPVTWLRLPDLAVPAYFILAGLLCWSHLVVVPVLAGKGRHTTRLDAGLVLAGAFVATVAVAAGAVAGLAAGIVTFFLLGAPGFVVGGAVTGSLAAAMMRRLRRAAPPVVPPGQAVLVAMGTAVALVAVLVASQSPRTVLVATPWLGLAAGIATCPAADAEPAGKPGWLRWRWAIWAVVLASVALPVLLIRCAAT